MSQDPSHRPWRLALLGPPGAGKGTQSQLLAQRLGLHHLSTGEIFRAAQSISPEQRSAEIADAVERISRGELVPDATVMRIVADELRRLPADKGVLFDGVPRTVAQAEALETLLDEDHRPLDAVFSYELPLDEIIARLSGRRTCANCQAIYHLVNHPPRQPDRCDRCGGPLVQRDDDRPEAIRVRLDAFEERTRPVIDFYRARGLLQPVPAQGAAEEAFHRTLDLLTRVP